MKTTIAKIVMSAFLPLVAVSVLNAAVPSSATMNVPGKMNYQGYLQDPRGYNTYSDGIYTLDCRIYNSETGGTCLWGGRYRAYVKNGYFNIMLGDETSTQSLDDTTGITYTGASNFWKSLWGANDTDTVRYLGVTIHQDSSGSTIENPTEIQPRQQLLSTPFAFRAQQAKYASEAKGDFTVGGKLTVKGTTTFSGTINAKSGTQQVGPIRASSSSVNLGNGYTSATASNSNSLPASIYGVAQKLFFYSYSDMKFAPTAGDVNFTIPSGKDMKVTGSGDFISDVPVNKIGGSGATTIKGANVSIKGYTSVEGSSIRLKDTAGDSLELYNGSITGKGNFRWTRDSNGLTAAPFQIKRINVTVKASTSNENRLFDTTDDYCWTVVGYEVVDVMPSNRIRTIKTWIKDGEGWMARVHLDGKTTVDCTFTLTLLGINSKMASFNYNPQ